MSDPRAGGRRQRLLRDPQDRGPPQAAHGVRPQKVAPRLRIGAPPECPSRPLCLGDKSQRIYGLQFRDVRALRPRDTGRRRRPSAGVRSTSRCCSPAAASSPGTRCCSATTRDCNRPRTRCWSSAIRGDARGAPGRRRGLGRDHDHRLQRHVARGQSRPAGSHRGRCALPRRALAALTACRSAVAMPRREPIATRPPPRRRAPAREEGRWARPHRGQGVAPEARRLHRDDRRAGRAEDPEHLVEVGGVVRGPGGVAGVEESRRVRPRRTGRGAAAITNTTSGRVAGTSVAHCCCQAPVPPHWLAAVCPSGSTNDGKGRDRATEDGASRPRGRCGRSARAASRASMSPVGERARLRLADHEHPERAGGVGRAGPRPRVPSAPPCRPPGSGRAVASSSTMGSSRLRRCTGRRSLAPMASVTIIADDISTVEATVADGRILLEPGQLPGALGWTLKPEGLCRDDVCVPVRDRAALFHDGRLDLAAVADALGRLRGGRRRRRDRRGRARRASSDASALQLLTAPDFELADLDGTRHRLSEWRGTEAAAPRVLLLVRLPLRPARVAGPAGRARGRELHRDRGRARRVRRTTSARGPTASRCRCSSTRSTC